MSRLAASLAVVLLLAGCGFQLQGAVTIPDAMEQTWIDTSDRKSLFYRQFRRALLDAGVELVDSPADATAIFSIYYDATDQRVLSVSARNVPTEYEVFYTIEYGLVSGDQTLIQRQDMTLTRDYTYDPTLVLGKAAEEQVIRESLVNDLVRIVLKQISAQ